MLNDERTLISHVVDSQLIEKTMDSWATKYFESPNRSYTSDGLVESNFARIVSSSTTKIGVACAYEDYITVIVVFYDKV